MTSSGMVFKSCASWSNPKPFELILELAGENPADLELLSGFNGESKSSPFEFNRFRNLTIFTPPPFESRRLSLFTELMESLSSTVESSSTAAGEGVRLPLFEVDTKGRKLLPLAVATVDACESSSDSFDLSNIFANFDMPDLRRAFADECIGEDPSLSSNSAVELRTGERCGRGGRSLRFLSTLADSLLLSIDGDVDLDDLFDVFTFVGMPGEEVSAPPSSSSCLSDFVLVVFRRTGGLAFVDTDSDASSRFLSLLLIEDMRASSLLGESTSLLRWLFSFSPLLNRGSLFSGDAIGEFNKCLRRITPSPIEQQLSIAAFHSESSTAFIAARIIF